MERSTADLLCFLVVMYVSLVFILDLVGVAWAMITKKPYKSMIGGFIERFLEYPSLFWMPILLAIMYAYFFFVVHPY